jgi:hypothetical protein
MKAIVKRLLRAAWRRLAPVRQPILRKYDKHLLALLAPQIETSVKLAIGEMLEERVSAPLRDVSRGAAENLERIGAFCEASTRAGHETDLVLNSLVREVVRLQMQVEYLQQLVSPPETLDRSSPAVERVLVG